MQNHTDPPKEASAMAHPTINEFERTLAAHSIHPLARPAPQTLQLNLGKRCNQVCRHCHVGAGPHRTEAMDERTMDRLLTVLRASRSIRTVDITGGAPELHPAFRRLVVSARQLGHHVIDRCNLTVLSLATQQDTAAFLAENTVEVVASLPCYGSENVDKQRGKGTFEQSIEGLHQLNALGYGRNGTGLILNLVYNPLGAFLPPDQRTLEQAYKEQLSRDFGIEFNHLYTITNMPIARFKADLSRSGAFGTYIELLRTNFNPSAVEALMCKDLISISYDGSLYDCDFNQMLTLKSTGTPRTIWDIDCFDSVAGNPIATGTHCLGCTAGAGSSCGGALQ